MLGDKQREVRVFGVQVLALVAVPVDRHDAVRVFVDDDAVRVHAERAHRILIALGAVDDLAFIELVGQVREHDGGQLHAHAEIDAVGVRRDAETLAEPLHPCAAASADRDDQLVAGIDRVLGMHKIPVADLDVLDRRVEQEVDRVLEIREQVFQNDVVEIGAEMAHRRVQKRQLVLDAELFEARARGREDARAFAAVRHVDRIDVLHQLKRLVLADVLVQRAAEIVGDVVFAVGERACAAEARHDRAGLALDAVLDLYAVDRAAPRFERVSLFDDRNLEMRGKLLELVCRINAAGACADDDDVIMLVHRFLRLFVVRFVAADLKAAVQLFEQKQPRDAVREGHLRERELRVRARIDLGTEP